MNLNEWCVTGKEILPASAKGRAGGEISLTRTRINPNCHVSSRLPAGLLLGAPFESFVNIRNLRNCHFLVRRSGFFVSPNRVQVSYLITTFFFQSPCKLDQRRLTSWEKSIVAPVVTLESVVRAIENLLILSVRFSQITILQDWHPVTMKIRLKPIPLLD